MPVPKTHLPGTVLEVFTDPVSEQTPEGRARIVKCLIVDSPVSKYVVHFLEDVDPLNVERWVKNP
jgi:hypothetical protein